MMRMRCLPLRCLGLLLAGLLGGLGLSAQGLGWQVGLATSYDYGVSLPTIAGYAPYSKRQSAAVTFDCTVGIPVHRFTFYPSYQFSIPTSQFKIQNLRGDYIPGGYGQSLPYANANPDVLYSASYYDLSSQAEIWQKKAGTSLLVHLGGGLELGTGLFWRQKRTVIYDKLLYDAYDYVGSVGTQTDEYSYEGTYTDHFEVQRIQTNHWTIPLVMQWRYIGQGYYASTAITRWTGDGDGYWSFRYGMGLMF